MADAPLACTALSSWLAMLFAVCIRCKELPGPSHLGSYHLRFLPCFFSALFCLKNLLRLYVEDLNARICFQRSFVFLVKKWQIQRQKQMVCSRKDRGGGGCIGVVRCCILARKKHNWRVMKRFSMECNQVLV